MKRYHITVWGRVQGVGFRYFAIRIAASMNLKGWVHNCYDGNVEIEVQGEDEQLNSFIESIRKGNLFIRIENVYIDEIELKDGEKSFKLMY